MRIVSILFSVFLVASGSLAQKTPSADDLAHRTVDLLGGGALERARYFSFTFKVEKNNKEVSSSPQQWDRVTGDYHVSARRPDGISFDATINVKTGAVRGTIEGRSVSSPDELKKLFQFAYERYINDTFWVLMPLMMLDPPFQRAYDGPRNDTCGHTWDLLKLTVAVQPGNPPAGTYWPWINRNTGMVEEWDMKPAGMSPDMHPIEVVFHDYRRVAGLLISLRREVRGPNQTVRFDDLLILPEPPKGAFKE
jgi:hypothetical protein